MPNLTLIPAEPTEISPTRRNGLVAHGLPPTTAVPTSTKKPPESPPAYAPCPACGALVLTGETSAGVRVALETQIPTYVPLWLPEVVRPTLHESRGYPVHQCHSLQGA